MIEENNLKVNSSNNIVINEDVWKEDSKRITALRFLLIVFVVFIHNNIKADTISDYNIIFDEPNIITWIKYIICNVLGGAAVPLFYLFASYLQFKKNDSYKTLILKKTRSLLIPYFLWTLINVLLYFIAQSLPVLSSFFQNEKNIVRNFSFTDWIKLFWAHEDGFPFVYQFWFLRNLIVIVFISPILQLIAKKIPITFGLIIIVCFINGLPFDFGSTLFFYMAGYYCSKYNISFFAIADKLRWYEYVFLIVFITIVTKFYSESIQLCGLGTIITCLFFLKVSGVLINKIKLYELLSYLSGFSFFLYAIHTPFLETTLKKLSLKIIPLQGIFCFVQFIVPCVLVIIIGVGIGIILKKLCYPLFKVLNGGR